MSSRSSLVALKFLRLMLSKWRWMVEVSISVWMVYRSVSKNGSPEIIDPRPEKGSTQEDRFLSATSAETWNDQAPPSLGQESFEEYG